MLRNVQQSGWKYERGGVRCCLTQELERVADVGNSKARGIRGGGGGNTVKLAKR